MKNNKQVDRPVRLSDYLIIITGFFLNLLSVLQALADELHQLALYNAHQKSQTEKIWQEFTQDLETLKEE